MGNAVYHHALRALERAERPLLVVPPGASVDILAAGAGLIQGLALRGKTIAFLSPDGIPEVLKFTEPPATLKDLPNLRTLTISLSTDKAKVDELSYAVVGDEVRIHVIPKEGVWSVDDVRVGTTGFRYDLVVAVGAQSLSDLGPITERYADFFYDTSILVIDPTPLQGVFGQFHLSDPLATSTSEVVARFFAEVAPESLKAGVATTLLTGMIARTKSFKVDGVTPRTLDMASTLMNAGARREEIVEKLYRTRGVETLRLWGHALTNLQAEPRLGLAWTSLTRRDFMGAKATEAAITDVVSELVATAPDARVILLCYEKAAGGVAVKLFAEHPHDALLLGSPFAPTGTRMSADLKPKGQDLVSVEAEILTHLRQVLKTTTRSA